MRRHGGFDGGGGGGVAGGSGGVAGGGGGTICFRRVLTRRYGLRSGSVSKY